MPKVKRFDRELLMNADRTKVARRTVELANNVQTKDDREATILSIASLFLLLCRALRLQAQEVFTAATNLMADKLHPDGLEHRFAALLMFLEDDVVEGRVS